MQIFSLSPDKTYTTQDLTDGQILNLNEKEYLQFRRPISHECKAYQFNPCFAISPAMDSRRRQIKIMYLIDLFLVQSQLTTFLFSGFYFLGGARNARNLQEHDTCKGMFARLLFLPIKASKIRGNAHNDTWNHSKLWTASAFLLSFRLKITPPTSKRSYFQSIRLSKIWGSRLSRRRLSKREKRSERTLRVNEGKKDFAHWDCQNNRLMVRQVTKPTFIQISRAFSDNQFVIKYLYHQKRTASDVAKLG